ncbi:MAG: PQQ-binding-like beta-propeller repeat protein [Kiritimatiellia bacterium]|jgi:outer membrane protein assembly factor BamB|nr:PQQ-binding-like beta-propeller repeat protein [Kiritimatiellia bacterium]
MRKLVCIVLFLTVLCAGADDWPMFRHDNQRSAVTREHIELPLNAAWVHTPAAVPVRAWTEPKTRNISAGVDGLTSTLDYDRAYHVIAAEGKVYYASSTTDSVYCLAADGSLVWTCSTEGPVRLAPVYCKGKIYVGSDDGFVHCFDAGSGAVQWSCQTGPEDRRIPGNGRIISQWPVRGGLVVHDGLVYYCAGVFPSHGAYMGAVDAANGEKKWTQNLEVSPQGYMLAAEDKLFVPTGRTPFQAYSLKDGLGSLKLGKSTSWGKRLHGGCFGTVVDGKLASGPSEDGKIDLFDNNTSVLRIPALQLLVDGDTAYVLSRNELAAHDWTKLRENKKRRGESNGLKWTQKMEASRCMIKAADLVLVGGKEWIGAFSLESGEAEWRSELEGTVESMAVSDGRLYASTDDGRIHCFATGKARKVEQRSLVKSMRLKSQGSEQLPAPLAHAAKTSKGYALVLGLESGQRLAAIARAGNCRVIGRDPDPQRVNAARKYLMTQGLYGTRVAVHQGTVEKLPYTDYFANIITSERDNPSTSAAEIMRVLRPHGGLLFLRSTDNAAMKELAAAFPGSRLEQNGKKLDLSWTRPKLEGEGEWTHFYADPANTACSNDKLVSWPMKLQWFGRPGPDRMTDRHNKTSAPLYKNGRMIVPGLNYFVGVDAYNGSILWEKDVPDSVRIGAMGDSSNIALGDEVLYIAAGDECLKVDPQSGRELGRLSLDTLFGNEEGNWAYLATVGELVYGSVSRKKSMPRREIRGRDAIWRGGEPRVICSDRIFAVNDGTDKLRWQYQPASGIIVNPTIAIAHGRIYFIQSENPEAVNVKNGQVGLRPLLKNASIVALDAKNGKQCWKHKILIESITDAIYLSIGADTIIVTGSHYRKVSAEERRGRQKPDQPMRTRYEVFAVDCSKGKPLWSRLFTPNRDHELNGSHGINIQHPSIVDDTVYGPGFAFNIRSGKDINGWRWEVGQKCGTVSTSREYAFCRFSKQKFCYIFSLETGENAPLSKASRPGCWINIIPAGGLVLVPESSAGCTCEYSVQTSMAFLPR